MAMTLLVGCQSAAPETVLPESEPAPATPTELPPTPEPTEVVIEPDYCVECHTDKERLIDVRKPEELAEKGVITAVDQQLLSIPLEDFMADKALWPADKDAEIVVYCGSGYRSTMAMAILLSEGYTNVTSLKGDYGGWAEAGLPVTEYVAQ